METVTHALRWTASRDESHHKRRHPHRFNELAKTVDKWSGKHRLACVDVQQPESKATSVKGPCGCTALEKPKSRVKTKQTDSQEKQPLHVACISVNLKCWGAWDITCRHKAKGTTPLTAWWTDAQKEVAHKGLPWKDEKGPLSVSYTLAEWYHL